MQSTSRQTTDIIGLSMAHCGGEERAEFAKLTVYMVPKLLIPKLLVHKLSFKKTLFNSVALDVSEYAQEIPTNCLVPYMVHCSFCHLSVAEFLAIFKEIISYLVLVTF
jgi:hypothetical protein